MILLGRKKLIKALFPSYNNLKMTYFVEACLKRERERESLDLFTESNCTIRSLTSEKIPNAT